MLTSFLQHSYAQTIIIIDDITRLSKTSASGFSSQSLPHFQLYPNPAKRQINLAISNRKGLKSIEIFDLMGKRVFKSTQTQGMITLPDLKRPATYSLKLTFKQGTLSEKFILGTLEK